MGKLNCVAYSYCASGPPTQRVYQLSDSLVIPVTSDTVFSLSPITYTHAFNQFGFVYIFNLIIGVGALALPKAFSDAGLVLGTILLVLLCFVSYMTTTYTIEAMAAANAYEKKWGSSSKQVQKVELISL